MTMTMRSSRLPILAVLAATVVSLPAAGDQAKPAPAKVAAAETAPSLGIAYTISFWGIPFGHTDFQLKLRDKVYSTISNFETSGIVSMFWQAKIEANSNGQIAANSLQPAVYDSMYQRGTNNKEQVKVTFSGASPTVEANPPYDLAAYPVTEQEKKEAVDPLSAVTLILTGLKADPANPCGTVAPVYDGRRRYNIEFTYLKDEKTNVQTALGKGTAHLCQVRQHQISGYKPRILKDGKNFPPIYGWFVDVPNPGAPNGHYVVALKVWAATGWGTVDATLSQLHVNGADLIPKG